MNSTLKFILISGCGMGNGVHIIKAKVRARVGAIINKVREDVNGCIGSLVNSLIASAIGCNRPYGPTILGPFRSCIYPSTFRSNRVKNATANRIGIIIISKLIKYIKLLKRGIEPLILKS